MDAETLARFDANQEPGSDERALIAAQPGLVHELGPEDARLLPDVASSARLEAMELLLDAGDAATAVAEVLIRHGARG